MKFRLITLFIFIVFASPHLFAQTQGQSRCMSQPEYRQFDFWIGEWEVTNPDGRVVGSSKIELTSGDCLILENWTSASGLTGKSMNYYSLFDSQWHQLWMGSNGIPIEFSGSYDAESKAMKYTGKGIGQNGEEVGYQLAFYHSQMIISVNTGSNPAIMVLPGSPYLMAITEGNS